MHVAPIGTGPADDIRPLEFRGLPIRLRPDMLHDAPDVAARFALGEAERDRLDAKAAAGAVRSTAAPMPVEGDAVTDEAT